jgi:iron complex outermembrane receptor protein
MQEMRRIILFLIFTAISLVSSAAYQVRNATIHGRISDTLGNPLGGASVTIENTYLGVISEPDGTYTINGLTDGGYIVRFSLLGYKQQIKEIDLHGKSELNVTLISDPMVTGEVIVSATRADQNYPLAYTTIDNEALKKQNTGQDIPFILSLTPSLIETSEAGNGIGYTNLRIRGTDASRINVTIDGIPLNDPESQQVFWVDLPDIASSTDNIQVQRGAGTSSNGAGAFGATVSILTKYPENDPYAQISSSFGSFNTFKNTVSAGTGLLAGRFALQVRLSQLKSDGYIDRTGSDHKAAFISGIYRNEKSSLKANIILGEEHTGIGWWGVPKEMLTINRRYNPAGEYTDESGTTQYYGNESDNYIQDHYQLIYSHTFSSVLSFNAALHYTFGKGYYEEYGEDAVLADYGLGNIIIGDSVISSSDLVRRKWLKNDFYGMVYSFKYKKNRLGIIFGGGANYYSGDHYGQIIWMRNAGTLEKDYQWYFNTGIKSEVSFYGKTDYSVSNSLSLFGDLQYRYIGYRMKGPDDDLRDLNQDHTFSFFNPKAGIFYSLTRNQDLYLSFSVANREPSRADFKEATGDPDATPRPETLYDTEMGYKLRGEKYSASVNLYGMYYKNQLVPTGELSNVGYSITTNVDKSYRLGIEISAGFKPVQFLQWDFNATLSRNKITGFTEYYIDYNTSDWSQEYKNKNLGTVDIAYSPSVIGTSDMSFKILKNLGLHFISKYVGKQYFDNTMSSDRVIDPYFVNNLRIDFNPVFSKIGEAQFQVLVNNILNSKYESNAYGGNWYEDGTEKTWSYYFPQAGTNFMLRASLMF